MTENLEGRLKALQSLEVGNVERVIGEVERTKLETEAVADNLEQESYRYMDLMREKLPKVIGNIYLLGNQISGLKDDYHSFYPVDLSGESARIEIGKKKSKKGFSLRIDNFIKYAIELKFEKDSNSPTEISFLNYEFPNKFLSWKKYKQSYVPKLKARTIEEFTAKFMDFLMSKNGREEGRYDSLPAMLNLIPSLLLRIYQEEQEKYKYKAEQTASKGKKLEELDVSDFS
ncbi:MAG: hypothetical protein ABSG05_00215 [Candidatus Pacearchaeota archaeon]|jgi:hypothetical protein